MIIKDLFVNLSILVSILFFYSQIFKKSPLSSRSPYIIKVLAGIWGGLLSILLMLFSIKVSGTFVDLRHIPTILVAYYGGALPAIISMILTIIGRYFISTNVFYYALLMSVSGTLFAIYFSKRNFSKKFKVTMILTFNNLMFSAIFGYLVHNIDVFIKVIPVYWLVSSLSAYLSFYVIGYIRRSQRLYDKYLEESVTDSLTGLNNKRKFNEVFKHLIKETKENDLKLSLLYIDIDFFKHINDTYGHETGDAVLKELGIVLQKNTRPFDIVSRNGGEEFTVLLRDCPLSRAVEIAERIRENVENHTFSFFSGKKIKLTISIGVSSFQDTTTDPAMLIEDADKSLYQAKKTGRNKVCIAPYYSLV
ncbi:diguanylate cyclase [Bacillus sp. JJ1764]|uniref:diguanylate cyclase n=1 Tax=Bacillus sp. JJ1764 TaxID=3122964 RepID=UPI0030004B84